MSEAALASRGGNRMGWLEVVELRVVVRGGRVLEMAASEAFRSSDVDV